MSDTLVIVITAAIVGLVILMLCAVVGIMDFEDDGDDDES